MDALFRLKRDVMTLCRFPRVMSLFLALLMIAEPTVIMAQEGYGQAMGQRRQINMPMSKQETSSSFNQPGGAEALQEAEMMRYGMQGGSLMGGEYQIHLLGQVQGPGTYRFPPSTRMAEALERAGGVLQMGSQRQIELRRGREVFRYDLFRFRHSGDLSQNPFLLDNDVIFVPFSKRNVEIQGPVKSNGIFELSSREGSVQDLIKLVGGFTAGVSYETPVVIIRYEGQEKKLIEIRNNSTELSKFDLQNGDIVIIPHILTATRRFDYNVGKLPADNIFYPSFNDNVFVMGAVQLPGAYPFNQNYSLRDYVSMAGMIRGAKTSRVRVITSDGKKLRGMKLKNYELSPGDTIVVPERVVSADSVLNWYNAIATSIITGFTLRELIRR